MFSKDDLVLELGPVGGLESEQQIALFDMVVLIHGQFDVAWERHPVFASGEGLEFKGAWDTDGALDQATLDL